MTVRNVKKNLAGQQDLLSGVGPYNQIRRGVAVSVDGTAKSYIELWKSYCGDAYVGTFEDGFTAAPGNVAISLILGKAYRYTGATQVIVAKDSSPDISWSELVVSTASLLVREALRRSYAEAGRNLVDGSFEVGGTLVNANDVLLQERTGKAFSGPAGKVAAGTNPVGGGYTDVSNRVRVEFRVNDYGAKADGVADDTIAIILAMRDAEAYKGTVVFSGDYVYDTVTAGGTQTFSLNRVDVRGYGRAVVSVKGSGTVWNINSNSQVSAPDFSNISFINIGNADVMCSFNVTYGQNIWGSSSKFHKVKVSFFKDTQFEFTQCFNCSFSKCEFNGADGQSYSSGIRLPAIAGKTSSCIRIRGGNPAWSGPISVSNLFHFEQCIFQYAKYGVDSYYLDQATFDSCTWQYLWIGVKLAIDGVNGDFNSSKVAFIGINYAEWIANRVISNVPILDDGVTEGSFLARGYFTSATRHDFLPTSYQGSDFHVWGDSLRLSRFTRANAPSSTSNYATFNTYDPDTQTSVPKYSVDSNGITKSNGHDFSQSINGALDPTETSTILTRYSYRYSLGENPAAIISGLSGTVTETVTQITGHKVDCSIKAGGTIAGSGGITISTGKQVTSICNVTLVSSGNAAITSVFARTLSSTAHQVIHLYKDSACTTPLMASDLATGPDARVQIGISWFQ